MKPVVKSIRRRLASEIAKERRAAGLSQRELARRLKRSPAYVSKLEAGLASVSVVQFVDIARALGVDPVKLLSRAEARRR